MVERNMVINMKFIETIKKHFTQNKDERVINQITLENLRNLRGVSLFIVVFEIISIALYSLSSGRNLRVIAQVMFCVIGCIIISFVSARMLRKNKKGEQISSRLVIATIIALYAIMTVWSIWIDVNHYINGEQMLTYYVVQFCFSIFLFIPSYVGLAMLTIGFGAF